MSQDSRPVAADVSVVIPTVGRSLILDCLEAIADGSLWPAELLVVNQGKGRAVSDRLALLRQRGMRVHHVLSSQTGISAGTNRGLERVRTPYVAVTHDDCRVRSHWLETLSARVRTVGDAVLTGRVEPEGDGEVLTIVTRPDPVVYTRPLLDGDVLFPPNMAFAMRLLSRIGYFDEHPSLHRAGEDNEWAYRALRAGVPIVYDPMVVVGHLARHSERDLASLHRRYALGQGGFYGKYLSRGDTFIARRALRDLVRGPWLLLRGLATRNRRLIAMGVGETTGILPGIAAGLRSPFRS